MVKRKATNWVMGAIYICLFVSLVAIAYTILAPRLRESFQVSSGTSSRSLYRTSKTFDNDVAALSTVLTDSDDALLMAGCYQFSTNQTPDKLIPQDCLFSFFELYTNTFDEVREKIITSLQSFITSTLKTKLSGDAYVLLSQSPYMRDSNGNVITTQYNISSYNFEPKVGPNLNDTPLYVRYYVILPQYDRNYNRKQTATAISSILNSYRTNKDQCFVKCVNDNTNSYCGCLNTTKNSVSQSYTSSCSSTPDLTGDTNKSVNIPANFYIMYKVNPLSELVARSNIFDR